MAELNKGMWNLALKPLKTYLNYNNAYGKQTLRMVTYLEGQPTNKVT